MSRATREFIAAVPDEPVGGHRSGASSRLSRSTAADSETSAALSDVSVLRPNPTSLQLDAMQRIALAKVQTMLPADARRYLRTLPPEVREYVQENGFVSKTGKIAPPTEVPASLRQRSDYTPFGLRRNSPRPLLKSGIASEYVSKLLESPFASDDHVTSPAGLGSARSAPSSHGGTLVRRPTQGASSNPLQSLTTPETLPTVAQIMEDLASMVRESIGPQSSSLEESQLRLAERVKENFLATRPGERDPLRIEAKMRKANAKAAAALEEALANRDVLVPVKSTLGAHTQTISFLQTFAALRSDLEANYEAVQLALPISQQQSRAGAALISALESTHPVLRGRILRAAHRRLQKELQSLTQPRTRDLMLKGAVEARSSRQEIGTSEQDPSASVPPEKDPWRALMQAVMLPVEQLDDTSTSSTPLITGPSPADSQPTLSKYVEALRKLKSQVEAAPAGAGPAGNSDTDCDTEPELVAAASSLIQSIGRLSSLALATAWNDCNPYMPTKSAQGMKSETPVPDAELEGFEDQNEWNPILEALRASASASKNVAIGVLLDQIAKATALVFEAFARRRSIAVKALKNRISALETENQLRITESGMGKTSHDSHAVVPASGQADQTSAYPLYAVSVALQRDLLKRQCSAMATEMEILRTEVSRLKRVIETLKSGRHYTLHAETSIEVEAMRRIVAEISAMLQTLESQPSSREELARGLNRLIDSAHDANRAAIERGLAVEAEIEARVAESARMLEREREDIRRARFSSLPMRSNVLTAGGSQSARRTTSGLSASELGSSMQADSLGHPPDYMPEGSSKFTMSLLRRHLGELKSYAGAVGDPESLRVVVLEQVESMVDLLAADTDEGDLAVNGRIFGLPDVLKQSSGSSDQLQAAEPSYLALLTGAPKATTPIPVNGAGASPDIVETTPASKALLDGLGTGKDASVLATGGSIASSENIALIAARSSNYFPPIALMTVSSPTNPVAEPPLSPQDGLNSPTPIPQSSAEINLQELFKSLSGLNNMTMTTRRRVTTPPILRRLHLSRPITLGACRLPTGRVDYLALSARTQLVLVHRALKDLTQQAWMKHPRSVAYPKLASRAQRTFAEFFLDLAQTPRDHRASGGNALSEVPNDATSLNLLDSRKQPQQGGKQAVSTIGGVTNATTLLCNRAAGENIVAGMLHDLALALMDSACPPSCTLRLKLFQDLLNFYSDAPVPPYGVSTVTSVLNALIALVHDRALMLFDPRSAALVLGLDAKMDVPVNLNSRDQSRSQHGYGDLPSLAQNHTAAGVIRVLTSLHKLLTRGPSAFASEMLVFQNWQQQQQQQQQQLQSFVNGPDATPAGRRRQLQQQQQQSQQASSSSSFAQSSILGDAATSAVLAFSPNEVFSEANVAAKRNGEVPAATAVHPNAQMQPVLPGAEGCTQFVPLSLALEALHRGFAENGLDDEVLGHGYKLLESCAVVYLPAPPVKVDRNLFLHADVSSSHPPMFMQAERTNPLRGWALTQAHITAFLQDVAEEIGYEQLVTALTGETAVAATKPDLTSAESVLSPSQFILPEYEDAGSAGAQGNAASPAQHQDGDTPNPDPSSSNDVNAATEAHVEFSVTEFASRLLSMSNKYKLAWTSSECERLASLMDLDKDGIVLPYEFLTLRNIPESSVSKVRNRIFMDMQRDSYQERPWSPTWDESASTFGVALIGVDELLLCTVQAFSDYMSAYGKKLLQQLEEADMNKDGFLTADQYISVLIHFAPSLPHIDLAAMADEAIDLTHRMLGETRNPKPIVSQKGSNGSNAPSRNGISANDAPSTAVDGNLEEDELTLFATAAAAHTGSAAAKNAAVTMAMTVSQLSRPEEQLSLYAAMIVADRYRIGFDDTINPSKLRTLPGLLTRLQSKYFMMLRGEDSNAR